MQWVQRLWAVELIFHVISLGDTGSWLVQTRVVIFSTENHELCVFSLFLWSENDWKMTETRILSKLSNYLLTYTLEKTGFMQVANPNSRWCTPKMGDVSSLICTSFSKLPQSSLNSWLFIPSCLLKSNSQMWKEGHWADLLWGCNQVVKRLA